MNNDSSNITGEELELFDRYLNNEMQEEERRLLTEKLEKSELLRQKVNYVRELQLGISEAALQEDMNQFHANIIVETQSNDQKKSPIKFKKYALAAMTVGTLLAISWLLRFQTNKQDKIFTTFYKPDPGLITAMSTQQDYIFDKGMVAYKIGNYKEAIQLWHSLEPERINSDTLQYFLGNAYLAQQENTKALDYLIKVSEKKQSAFYEDANWYLGLVYLKMNNLTDAIKYISSSTHEKKEALLDMIVIKHPKVE